MFHHALRNLFTASPLWILGLHAMDGGVSKACKRWWKHHSAVSCGCWHGAERWNHFSAEQQKKKWRKETWQRLDSSYSEWIYSCFLDPRVRSCDPACVAARWVKATGNVNGQSWRYREVKASQIVALRKLASLFFCILLKVLKGFAGLPGSGHALHAGERLSEN